MPESVKECGTVLPEGLDIGLGARCREFESPISGQNVLMKDAAQKRRTKVRRFHIFIATFQFKKLEKTGFFGQRVFGRDRRHFRDATGRFYELV